METIIINKKELKNIISDSVCEGINKVLNYDIKLSKKINFLGEEKLSKLEKKEFDEILKKDDFEDY